MPRRIKTHLFRQQRVEISRRHQPGSVDVRDVSGAVEVDAFNQRGDGVLCHLDGRRVLISRILRPPGKIISVPGIADTLVGKPRSLGNAIFRIRHRNRDAVPQVLDIGSSCRGRRFPMADAECCSCRLRSLAYESIILVNSGAVIVRRVHPHVSHVVGICHSGLRHEYTPLAVGRILRFFSIFQRLQRQVVGDFFPGTRLEPVALPGSGVVEQVLVVHGLQLRSRPFRSGNVTQCRLIVIEPHRVLLVRLLLDNVEIYLHVVKGLVHVLTRGLVDKPGGNLAEHRIEVNQRFGHRVRVYPIVYAHIRPSGGNAVPYNGTLSARVRPVAELHDAVSGKRDVAARCTVVLGEVYVVVSRTRHEPPVVVVARFQVERLADGLVILLEGVVHGTPLRISGFEIAAPVCALVLHAVADDAAAGIVLPAPDIGGLLHLDVLHAQLLPDVHKVDVEMVVAVRVPVDAET